MSSINELQQRITSLQEKRAGIEARREAHAVDLNRAQREYMHLNAKHKGIVAELRDVDAELADCCRARYVTDWSKHVGTLDQKRDAIEYVQHALESARGPYYSAVLRDLESLKAYAPDGNPRSASALLHDAYAPPVDDVQRERGRLITLAGKARKVLTLRIVGTLERENR